jgi:hypothetical protein
MCVDFVCIVIHSVHGQSSFVYTGTEGECMDFVQSCPENIRGQFKIFREL